MGALDHHYRRLARRRTERRRHHLAAGQHPVIVLRGHQLRPPHPELTLTLGDRISLLTVTPEGSPERHPGGQHDARPAGRETSHHK
jgi:hypothetical protein